MFNPNGESSISAAGAADDKRQPAIGMIAMLMLVDTLTPRMHEI